MGEEYQQFDCVYYLCHFKGLDNWLGKIMNLEEIGNHKLGKIQKFLLVSNLPLDMCVG
jgi:hypothetical protein